MSKKFRTFAEVTKKVAKKEMIESSRNKMIFFNEEWNKEDNKQEDNDS